MRRARLGQIAIIGFCASPHWGEASFTLSAGERGRYDFAFIDADKTNYENYYECCLELLRPGGVIMADNVLWSGRVADSSDQTPDTAALRAFNRKLLGDPRVSLSMLTVDDGVTLALKK